MSKLNRIADAVRCYFTQEENTMNTRNRNTTVLTFASVILSTLVFMTTSTAHAVFIPFVNIDIGPSTQQVEPGWIGLSGTVPSSGANGATYGPTSLTAIGGEMFDFSINAVDWRDRGDSTSVETLVEVGEDFVKLNPGPITMTFGALPAGTYQVTSYHVDADFTQSAAIQISVTDDIGVGVIQTAMGDASQAVGGVNGLTTAIMNNSSATFNLVSNGTDPVIVSFLGTGGDTEVPVNGLQIEFDFVPPVPEPSTFVLAALGLLGMTRLRRRGTPNRCRMC